MDHQIFSFPLFVVARRDGNELQYAMIQTADGLALVMFTTREASNEFRHHNADAETVEIVDESHAENMLNGLPDADVVILDPKDGRGFVMLIQDFIESIQPQRHDLN